MQKYLYETKHFLKIFKDLKKIKKKFEHLQKEEYSIPAAPDTSKFRVIVSGDISILINEIHRGGRYGVDRFLPICVTVGTSIDSEVHQAFKEYFNKIKGKHFYNNAQLKQVEPFFHESYGSCYCNYGLNTNNITFSDNAVKEIESILCE